MANARRRALVLAVVVVTALLVAGAAVRARTRGAERTATRPVAVATTPAGDAGAAPVIAPGRPGEPAVINPTGTPAGQSDRYNDLDAYFVRMMIPHHTQALQMAELAPDRAADPRIKVLADRIRASQVPEVLRMRGWLDARHLDADADVRGGHDHGTMRGMQTPDAMRRLTDARGADFDRLFVQMMIDHHEGAIEMATNVLKVGIDVTVEEMATSIAAEQAIEITRMRELFPA
ncbi:DUF305 domain-containing protein [Micromonospora sp. NPDC049559]|uniref:DUF305 domain-containing protein n=1 Tax=Micromonospora sp. NPDC049559 TaxID=3155923 RepID=UPI003449593E